MTVIHSGGSLDPGIRLPIHAQGTKDRLARAPGQDAVKILKAKTIGLSVLSVLMHHVLCAADAR